MMDRKIEVEVVAQDGDFVDDMVKEADDDDGYDFFADDLAFDAAREKGGRRY